VGRGWEGLEEGGAFGGEVAVGVGAELGGEGCTQGVQPVFCLYWHHSPDFHSAPIKAFVVVPSCEETDEDEAARVRPIEGRIVVV